MRRPGPVVVTSCCLVLVVAAVGIATVAGSATIASSDASADALTTADPVAVDGFDATTVETLVALRTNERRESAGLDELAVESTTREFSRTHSVEMAEQGYLGHQTPDGNDLSDRLRGSSVASTCTTVGENVARVYLDQPFEAGDEVYDTTDETEIAEALVVAWIDSPEHRENLLADKWDAQSVGVSVDADGAVYATHHFCLR